MKKIAFALLLSTASLGSSYAASGVINVPTISATVATKLVSEAVKNCAERGFPVSSSVINASGQRIAYLRGDGAPIDTDRVSFRKAYTVYSWGTSNHKQTTSELIDAKITGPADGSMSTIAHMLALPGGVLLQDDNKNTIGAIGVSGVPDGHVDEACAKEAIAKYKSEL